MIKTNLFKAAHKMAKDIKAEYSEVNYKFQFGLCLSYLSKIEGEIKMKVSEMIKKFNLELAEKDGVKGIRFHGKATKKQIEEIKASKPAIMEELNRIKTEKEAEKEKERLEKLARIESVKSGKEKIKVVYNDGEYLSGYSPRGLEAAALLEEIGVAEYVSGWGTYIASKVIEALGEEFTYQEAIEYMKPAIEAKRQAREKKEDERKAIFDKAKETGKKQLLHHYSDDCNDPNEECDVDIIYEYAMPNGTIEAERQHTW